MAANADRLLRCFGAQQEAWVPEGNRGEAGKAALINPLKNLTRIKTTQL